MHRQQFLESFLGAGASMAAGLYACAPTPTVVPKTTSTGALPARRAALPPRPVARRKIQAICFDLFTLFDPRSVVELARTFVPEQTAELCEAWRLRQFEYAWLRVAAEQYQDFRVVTSEALEFAARARKVTLSSAASEALVDAYSKLTPWPDTRDALLAWKRAGLRLAPLANYSPKMISSLLENAALTQLFDDQISTDAARTFKPDPRAYALGVSRLGLEREQIAFAAFGGWDAAGARWFGFPTFWVNRLGVAEEELAPGPDATGPTLAELGAFVSTWSSHP
jgi:2-haloacid dehalogenase